MNKTIGYLAFILLLLLTVVMGIATWQEHFKGTEYVLIHFYKSFWFNLLWAWLAVSGGYYIIKTELYKKLPVFVLHLSLLIILAGAMITRFNGKTGAIHLREGVEVRAFACEELNGKLQLPFTMELKEFRVEHYPGTSSPSNYMSVVKVTDNQSGETFEKEISMNNILKYKGYRFYQSSFDEDMKGSLLSVNRDSTGIAFTYAGYYLLFLSMVWILFDRKGRFFELRKKNFRNPDVASSSAPEDGSGAVSGKVSRLFLWLFVLFFSGTLYASPPRNFSEITIDREQSDRFARIRVNYHGRICPLQTLAVDYTTKLTGKPRFEGLQPEQFLLGWVFFPEDWQRIPLFEVRHPELKRIINVSGKACLNDFFDSLGQYKLEPFWREIHGSKQTAVLKEVLKLDEKVQLVSMLRNGNLLQIFPFRTNEGRIRWFSPKQMLPEYAEEIQQKLIDNFFPTYSDDFQKGNKEDALSLLELLQGYQQKVAGEVLPSEMHLRAELLYNRLSIFSLLFKIALTIGCIGMFLFIFYNVKNKEYRKIHSIFYYSLLLVFVVLTFGLCLRSYIAGRLPMSNGYETMLIISWTALLVGVLFRRFSFLITNFGLLLSGFALLVAHISSMNPYITPLVPVLQSPLLSIHVSLIMIAYGLCGFMVLNSLTSFSLLVFSGKGKQTRQQVVILKEMSELLMYPATFLLGAGIFVGAIWANVSWGRYWGWDPKEVWALITFILMSFTFHGKTISWFRKPVFYHLFVVIIFTAVLMTYFGVNYVLGGRHSYAG
jgi:ABC-type transport system involved in cytochrome c biogenesis permease subunit